jgi:hypothetical protein
VRKTPLEDRLPAAITAPKEIRYGWVCLTADASPLVNDLCALVEVWHDGQAGRMARFLTPSLRCQSCKRLRILITGAVGSNRKATVYLADLGCKLRIQRSSSRLQRSEYGRHSEQPKAQYDPCLRGDVECCVARWPGGSGFIFGL